MPNHEVVVKVVKPLLVASMRRVMPAHDKITPLYEELNNYLVQQGVTPSGPITIWHDESYRENDVDTEAAITLKAPVPGTATVKVYALPEESMASTVHKGSYNRLGQAYDILHAWIDTNGYRISGPGRELYLSFPENEPLRFDDERYVTEIQLPVQKA
jgi:effector-binding domain-containing protein